jgi:AraC-like DNA-binding protein
LSPNVGTISLRVVRDAAVLDREHAADAPQIIVPLESSVIDLEVAGASHRIDRSTFAVVPARAAHRMSARGSVVSLVVLGVGKAARDAAKREYAPDFSAETFDAIVSEARVLSRTRWVDEIVQRYVFERTVCEKHGSAAARFLETEITKELFFLGKEHMEKATRASVVREDDEIASRARAWIDAHLFESVAMKELARACRSSESTLLRAFRRAFGVPPTTYARNRRLDEALLLIESGRYTVSEVAVRVGYGTVSAFTVAFRRRFGAAPSESRPRERPVLPPHGTSRPNLRAPPLADARRPRKKN